MGNQLAVTHRLQLQPAVAWKATLGEAQEGACPAAWREQRWENLEGKVTNLLQPLQQVLQAFGSSTGPQAGHLHTLVLPESQQQHFCECPVGPWLQQAEHGLAPGQPLRTL